MPWFETIIRSVDPVTGNVDRITNLNIQVPGYARVHSIEPGTGKRIFLPVNQMKTKTPGSGALRLIFKGGMCFLPDPANTTDEELRINRMTRESAEKLLVFAMDKTNGRYGRDYIISMADADGYWKKTGELVPHPRQKTEFLLKKDAENIRRELEMQSKSREGERDSQASGIAKTVEETVVENDKKRRRGRPPGSSAKVNVIAGAKGTTDQEM